jgi:signal transduction histidine kinase
MNPIRRFAPFILCASVLLSAEVILAGKDGRDSLALLRVDSRLNVADFYVVDLDGDGLDDFIELFADRRIYMARSFVRERLLGPAMYQANFNHLIISITPVDIDTLPGAEVAIVLRDNDGDSLWVRIVSGSDKRNVLCQTEAVHGKNISNGESHKNPGWDGSVRKCYFADLEGDGTMEVIMPLTVGFDLYPRGIYVYRYPSGKLLWKFRLAGNPFGLSFADVDGDGNPEIFLRTWACHNGAVYDNRMDTAAYAIAIDHLGNELWRTNLGDRFDFQTGNLHVCDCDNDDTLEVYYTVLVASEGYDQQIRLLQKHRASDNLFLKQRSFDADHRFREICSADLDDDGLEELVINDRPTILAPGDLSILKEAGFKLSEIGLIEDIDGNSDNGMEMVLRKKDSLYVLNNELNLLAAYQAEYGGHIIKVKHFHTPFGKNYLGLIVSTQAPGLRNMVLCLMEVSQPIGVSRLTGLIYAHRLFWPSVVIAFVLGLPVGVILYRAFRSSKRHRIFKKSAPYENLMTSLATFNHGQMAGKNLNRLSFLFGNLPDNPDRLEEIKPNIEAAIRAYQSFASLQLSDIAKHGERLKQVRPVIDDLVKQAESLNRLLENVSVRELTADNGGRYRSSIPKAVAGLKDIINQIRRVVRSHFTVDLIKVIPNVLSAVAGRLQAQKVGIAYILIAQDIRKPVFFSEAELAAVIEELISNACTAMTDAETKKLSMRVEYSEDEVAIAFSDTGHGVQVKDSEKLFSRDYSTRDEDGGYGLFNARQKVERFGGHITIRNNNDDPGATAKLVLKTVGDE